METRSRAHVLIAVAALAAMSIALGVSLYASGSADAADDGEPQSIVGGTATSDGRYPFVTALLDDRVSGGAYYQQFCGGTLIDRDSVLTAAHCVDARSAGSTSVVVGRTVLSQNQGQRRGVSRIFIHPNYNGNASNAYDAAVLKLDGPVSGIAPVRLSTSSQDYLEKAGRSATVAGWGNTNRQSPDGGEPDAYADRMREARVPLVSDSSARNAYGRSFVPALMVSAGRTGKDTCQGDSGGPAFANVSGRYTQIGITSFGAGCGSPGYPGVYAEVNNPSIRNFITSSAAR